LLRGRITNRRLCLVALAALVPLQSVAVTSGDGDGDERAVALEGQVIADAPPTRPAKTWPTRPEPSTAPELSSAASVPGPGDEPQLVTEPDVVPTDIAPVAAPVAAPPPPMSFAERFPTQATAVQDPADPATTRWAVLIGINEHRGTVADNIGSRQDAEDLRAHLLASGWRDDHILLLTDRTATRANIVDAIAWLAERTDEDSVAVFHYSGHSKKWYGRDVDGDGERTDEGLWPTDDRFIVDSELVRLLDPVRPHAFWISFATCNAAGLADPGLVQPGRILTFSSGEPQKSYENPAWGNSVWGWLMIEQAFAGGVADADHDGRVTVEEAFAWTRPRARDTTTGQRYGPQDGVIVDMVDGAFDLLVPGAPRPARQEAASEPRGDRPPPERASGQPAPAPSDDPEEPREPTEENHGNRICLLCDR
jgi:hypothetical protein